MDDAAILPIHDTARFLECIGASLCLFQTFAEPKGGNNGLNRVLLGTLGQRHLELQRLNERGAAICFMVNEGDGTKGRKAENVTRVRCVFVDLDGAPLDPIQSAPLQPHVIVESSPGRFHAYWRVEGCPVSEFRRAQKHLAVMFAGDESVCDLPRVMRLPGFLHRKAEPFRSRVLDCRTEAAYAFDDWATAFGMVASKATAEDRRLSAGNRNNGLFAKAQGLRRQGIDADEARRRLAQVNAATCDPPLPDSEVGMIVASAYQGDIGGFVILPNALLDSEAYRALKPEARNLLDLCYRQHRPTTDADIVLSHGNFRRYFPARASFYRLREQVIASGLVVETKASKAPRLGCKPEAGHFRLRYLHSPKGGTIK